MEKETGWITRFFDPDQKPSMTSVLSFIAGIIGLGFGIYAVIVEGNDQAVELSKFFLSAGLLGKGMQHIVSFKR